ncbi:hypothetical protein FrEUN1fDRAFT_7210 [Parafrankia sp. EUN1f]|nr:hypothetical protein FrEUN1fDRAFT_7210 [Parafrankia sp. EUN1f]
MFHRGAVRPGAGQRVGDQERLGRVAERRRHDHRARRLNLGHGALPEVVLDATPAALRAAGRPVADADVARLSPLGHAHLNCLGRYSFSAVSAGAGLRPLRDPAEEREQDE